MINLAERKKQIQDLVNKFDANKNYYLSSKYNESQLRTDFLDEFFTILGWDGFVAQRFHNYMILKVLIIF